MKDYTPSNKNMQEEARRVLEFLAKISADKIITGQHTQTLDPEELRYIVEKTGKHPALLGFELLSYSSNINYLDTDEECMKEVVKNNGTLKEAWEWARKGGLITLTWHWFSPLYGRSKAFFSDNTEFTAEMAVKEGTKEYEATVADIRMMAGLLRPFAVKHIPILWRPLHEGEGDWFWWGVSGSEPLKKLYRLMYDIFVNEYHLDNLIWVWNSPRKEDYPGDDVVDVISRDMYPPAHVHTSQAQYYNDLIKITEADKPVIIAETGTLPDAKAIHDEKIGWSSYMTWSHGFCVGNEFNDEEELKKMYNSPYAITLENLPKLY